MEDLEYHTPVESSDPLAEDTLLEKIVWQGSIWLIYFVFAALFLVSLIS